MIFLNVLIVRLYSQKKNVKIEELLQKYEDADYDSNVEAIFAAKTYVQNLQKALPKFRGDVLDIGAGDGAFLSEAKKSFADKAVGIEPSSVAIKFNNNAEIKLLNIAIENFKTEDKFDLVTCFQTIEHLNNPKEFLTKISNYLLKGGFIAITCHNRSSVVNKLLKDKSPIFDIEHLQVFTVEGIEILFRKLGLEIVYSKSYKNSYPFHYWIKLAPIPSTIKNFILKYSHFFSFKVAINVGNHLIIGRLNDL